MQKARISKKALWICCAVVFVAVIIVFSLCICGTFNGDIPVITGVKENVVVYEDDSAETVNAALLDGVSTVGGDPCTIAVTVLSKEDGKEVQTLTVGEYELRYSCDRRRVEPVMSTLTVKAADTTPPTITGAVDKVVYVNESVSYREGVTVTDDVDENVQLKVDSSKVDLTKAGKYEVVYSATDSRGNTATVTVTVTVKELSDKNKTQTKSDATTTKEKLDALCSRILSEILTDGMTDREKAEAIYNRVRKITYVSTTEDPDWVVNAYVGLTTGRGDCVHYSAASRALLTQAGIPNYELERYGGTSDHYWEIVYVDGGWYHFDACPTSAKYPIKCFLLTDEEVIAYSNSRTDKPNYYIYDRDSCPYQVVQSRNS